MKYSLDKTGEVNVVLDLTIPIQKYPTIVKQIKLNHVLKKTTYFYMTF